MKNIISKRRSSNMAFLSWIFIFYSFKCSYSNREITKQDYSSKTYMDKLYESIDSNRKKNETLALKSDSIYLITKKSIQVIDSLKMLVIEQITPDTIYSSGKIIDSIFKLTLTSALQAVYDQTKSYSQNIQVVDSSLNDIEILKISIRGVPVYFKENSMAADITYLTKLHNDCHNAAIFVLSDIRDKISPVKEPH